MPEAARLGDDIGHEFDYAGLGGMIGGVIGGAIGFLGGALISADASVVAFALGGPIAGSIVSALGPVLTLEAGRFGQWAGSALGSRLGGWVADTLGLGGMVKTGTILTGLSTVKIAGMDAARACIDYGQCSRHPSAVPPMIVKGSKTVLIGGHPAARLGDPGACTFVILEGEPTVLIGGEPHTCDCASLWAQYRQEAEDVIAPYDHDHRQRNRAINRAYAQLYLRRPRDFVWAGLAAYASKQVGCAMDYSRQVMDMGIRGYGGAAGVAASYTYEMLGQGNRDLFLDVYPMHRFYEDHGYQRMLECAGARNPPVEPWALEAFRAASVGDRAGSLRNLAYHEQINILQRNIYDDYMFRRILAGNETGLPLTSPAAVVMDSGCQDLTPDGRHTHRFSEGWFSREHGAVPEIYEPGERMRWILDDIAADYSSFEGTARHIEDLNDISNQGP